MPSRLLGAEDQGMIRKALATLLDLEAAFEVVATVGRGDEVAAAAASSRPDVALLDIEMPGIDGLAAAAVLARQLPACRSLILTTFGRPGYLRRAMDAGASAFVARSAPAEEVLGGIRHAAVAATSFTASGLPAALARRRATQTALALSGREAEVLRLLRDGCRCPRSPGRCSSATRRRRPTWPGCTTSWERPTGHRP